MFVRAVGFHPNATVWLQGTQKFDLKDDRLIENVFADFGTAEDQRYNSTKVPVKAANGKRFYTQGLSTVNLTTLGKDGQIISSIILKNVWHAEDLENSLISCRTIFRDDSIACTLSDYATLTKVSSGEVVGYGDADNDLYWLRTDSKHQLETFYTSATFTTSATASVVRAMPIEVKPISIDLAHRRFCYAGEQRVRRMPAFAEGIKLIKGSALKTLCPLCLAGKGHQLPYGDNKSIRVRLGDSLHIDVWGPISIATKEGETYFMSITDKASRFCWIFLIKAHTDVIKCYQVVESYLLT
ncbi:uncharacterized protein N7477_003294 [Penicillium maclennaniae]|uniref:uncharacterized protein n=1 Tax=Penicillium maclennaniae TaxID=1343394 RepID=UPI002540219D|nr:uncharacterized protein N7477_003294 [Penicillium maclennaniae]KAJ5677661.1 hypothetical protein N7477_003294 [Penicillium maclennaniae]